MGAAILDSSCLKSRKSEASSLSQGGVLSTMGATTLDSGCLKIRKSEVPATQRAFGVTFSVVELARGGGVVNSNYS